MRIDEHIDCLNCGRSVAVGELDNLHEIMQSPESYTLIVTSDKCKCGLITVLEFAYDEHYSMSSTQSENPDWDIYRTGELVCEKRDSD